MVKDWTPPNSKYPPPKPDEPALFRASRVGDDGEIRRLVESGAAGDEIFDIRLDPSGRARPATPLMVAAGSGDGATVHTVRLLLELGASIGPGPDGRSALSFACAGLGWNYRPGGDADRIAELLGAGSDANVVGDGGVAMLADVAGWGDPARVRLLLTAGADPAPRPETLQTEHEDRERQWMQQRFERDPDQWEPPPLVMPVPCNRLPLHRAAQSASETCVRLLLTAGARAHNDGADHSILACATSTAMLGDLLAAGANPHGPGPFRTTITMSIAENRRTSIAERVQMLRALAAAGVDLDERALHATAISSCAMQGNADAVEALLAAGANPRGEPNAMAWACFSYSANRKAGIERVVDLLVAAGFDPNERDEQGYRPLHAALSPNEYGDGYRSSDGISVAAAAALIRNGASIDIVFPNFDDYGPLHIAAQERSAPALEVLLGAGADPLQRTPAGETPLDVARAVLASDEGVLQSTPEVPTGLERVDWPKEYASHRNAAAKCVRVLEEVAAVAGSPPNETR